MSTATFAKRYAQAVFEIAQEKKQLEEWRGDLKKAAELMHDAEFLALLEKPNLPFDVKAKLTQEKLGKVNQLTLNLAYLLITKGRFKNIGQITEQYEHLLDDHYGIMHAQVTTAVPLSEKDREKLSSQLAGMVGKKVSVNLKVDPDIVGGIVARINGSLIDGSIRNKLQILKRSLSETRR